MGQRVPPEVLKQMSVNLTQYNRIYTQNLEHAVEKAEAFIAEYKKTPPSPDHNLVLKWVAKVVGRSSRTQKSATESFHRLIGAVLFSSGFYAEITYKKIDANHVLGCLEMTEMSPQEKLENLGVVHPCGCVGEFHSCAASAKAEEEFQNSRDMD